MDQQVADNLEHVIGEVEAENRELREALALGERRTDDIRVSAYAAMYSGG
ncbi:hypothetical protein [Streptomyces sp. NPDC007264]